MKLIVLVCAVFAAVMVAGAEETEREKREAQPSPAVATETEREKRSAPHGGSGHHGYQQKSYYKSKQCYQCAYSPPKTYYDKKVYVEHGEYGKQYERDGYGHGQSGHKGQGYGHKNQGGYQGGYTKKSVVPVPYTVYGGWDKCIGPFTHYEAKHFGIDVWDCHSNCYTRRDPNGDVFRGCYKGEYNVNPHKLGCHKQAGSVYCFCEGEKCNNGPSPPQHY